MAWRVEQPEAMMTAGGAPPRLAFVHIPKTGGVSLTAMLARAYDGQVLPAMTTLDYPFYDAAELARFRFYKGHAYRRDYERLPPGTIRLTVLRDPVARAVSFWRYYRALDPAASEDPSIAEAIRLAREGSALDLIRAEAPFVIEHLRLGQVRQFLPPATLAAVDHHPFLPRALQHAVLGAFVAEMARFDHVLTSEMLPLSLPPVLRALGLGGRVGPLPRENVSPPAPDCDPFDLRRAVMEVNEVEFACYEHVRRREIAALSDAA